MDYEELSEKLYQRAADELEAYICYSSLRRKSWSTRMSTPPSQTFSYV